MSSRRLQDMSSRRLQRNNFSSSKTSSRRLARVFENVFKTSSRHFGRSKIVTLKTSSRHVLKTNKCLLGSNRPEVLLGKGVREICSKRTGEHLSRSVISIKLLCNFIEIAFRHGCSPVNLLHIFGTPFPRITFWVAASQI